MLIEIKGTVEFEPTNFTKKHAKQQQWKKTAMILTDCDLHLYYAWFIKKRFNLVLNRPIRGTHMTFINDRFESPEMFDKAKEIFNGKPITFYIDPEPRSNGEHWWLRAYSHEAESIREAVGLERIPYFTFHMTIGLANDKNIAHSNYILDQCKRFELISNEPRMDFEDHEIKNFE